jgi:hypothetical protein
MEDTMDMEHNKLRQRRLSQKPFAALLDLPLFQEDEAELLDPETTAAILQTVQGDVIALFDPCMSAESHGDELHLPSDGIGHDLSGEARSEPTPERAAQLLGTWQGEGYQELYGKPLHLPGGVTQIFEKKGFHTFTGIVRIHQARGHAIECTCQLNMHLMPVGGEVTLTARFQGTLINHHNIHIRFESMSSGLHINKLDIYLSEDAQMFSGTYAGDGAYTLEAVHGEIVFEKMSDDPQAKL